MSINFIFRECAFEIFNAFKKYITDKIIPDMVFSFNASGIEVDENTFKQFFEGVNDLNDFDEISKYLNKHNTENLTYNYDKIKVKKNKNTSQITIFHKNNNNPKQTPKEVPSETEKDLVNKLKNIVEQGKKLSEYYTDKNCFNFINQIEQLFKDYENSI